MPGLGVKGLHILDGTAAEPPWGRFGFFLGWFESKAFPNLLGLGAGLGFRVLSLALCVWALSSGDSLETCLKDSTEPLGYGNTHRTVHINSLRAWLPKEVFQSGVLGGREFDQREIETEA